MQSTPGMITLMTTWIKIQSLDSVHFQKEVEDAKPTYPAIIIIKWLRSVFLFPTVDVGVTGTGF